MQKSAVAVLFAAATSLIMAGTVQAQFRGPGGGFGGDGQQRRFDFGEMIRNMDANKNGTIDPSEQSGRTQFFLRRPAERAGLDMSQPMPVDKLIEEMEQSRGDRDRDGDRGRDRDRDDDGDRRRDDDRRRNDDRDNDRNRSPNAFGPGGNGSPAPAPGAGVVGFGAPAPATGGVAALGSSSSSQKYDDRVVTYVEDMLNRYDQNKDGYVDSKEWASGRWSTPPEESDTNKDNRLSKDELLVRIAKRFGSQRGGGDSSSNNSAQVRRFADSLIRQYDKNRDGRLQADEWKEMRTEHQSADADRDGIITTDELAVKLTNYASGSPMSSSSSSFGS